jgi:hypothetical protein
MHMVTSLGAGSGGAARGQGGQAPSRHGRRRLAEAGEEEEGAMGTNIDEAARRGRGVSEHGPHHIPRMTRSAHPKRLG